MASLFTSAPFKATHRAYHNLRQLNRPTRDWITKQSRGCGVRRHLGSDRCRVRVSAMTLEIGSLSVKGTSLVGTLIVSFGINWGAWVIASILQVTNPRFSLIPPNRVSSDGDLLRCNWNGVLYGSGVECVDQCRTLPSSSSQACDPRC